MLVIERIQFILILKNPNTTHDLNTSTTNTTREQTGSPIELNPEKQVNSPNT